MTKGLTSPGKDKLRKVIENKAPFVILIDELLEYVTKAAGVKVGGSNLAAQTVAFIQELSEVVSNIEKSCLIITLPSSIIEHYDSSAEEFYMKLQKVSGRIEKVYTPVSDNDISKVIRKRLFSDIDDKNLKKVINEVINYFEKENILSKNDISHYRERFMESYPFLPEVIDILYHRWGSIPTFQRTRGVLRILSLVINSLKNKNLSYISLSDFDLSNGEIRQELLKYIGPEYNSVVAQDITDTDCGSKKIDIELGESYIGLSIATRCSTSIFMSSFSGGIENGVTLSEIKRMATTLSNPSSVIADCMDKIKSKLFYIQFNNGKYFFSNQPNINRIVLTRMENVKDADLIEYEKKLLKNSLDGNIFKIYIWPDKNSDIPDTEELKLIILREEDKNLISDIIKNKGQTPRVNCNTIIFLLPMESERISFNTTIKRYEAYKSIESESATLKLTDEQKKNIKEEIEKLEKDLKNYIRRLYRIYALPTREGYKKEDMGSPIHGIDKNISDELYEKLKFTNEIIEYISPYVIKEKYLKEKDYIYTNQIFQSSYRVSGEPRYKDKSVLKKSIEDGVLREMFGLGVLEDDKPLIKYYKETPKVDFYDTEIIINSKCIAEENKNIYVSGSNEQRTQYAVNNNPEITKDNLTGKLQNTETDNSFSNLKLNFSIPKGKISDVMRVLNFINLKFGNLKIDISVEASEGVVTKDEYNNKIVEALTQLGIKLDKDR